MFPEKKSRETSGLEGKPKTSRFREGPDIRCFVIFIECFHSVAFIYADLLEQKKAFA